MILREAIEKIKDGRENEKKIICSLSILLTLTTMTMTTTRRRARTILDFEQGWFWVKETEHVAPPHPKKDQQDIIYFPLLPCLLYKLEKQRELEKNKQGEEKKQETKQQRTNNMK